MPANSDEIFNPFPENITDILISAFESRILESLPPEEIGKGAGVYGLYYTGKSKIYNAFNEHLERLPLYIGKAVIPGGRKGGGDKEASHQNYIVRRLREHARTISQAENLKPEDFRCRWLFVVPEFVNAAEAILIDHYQPLWNCVISGFGIHTPGSGRNKQARSDWDMLHPGRGFAGGLPIGNDPTAIISRIKGHFKKSK